MSTSFHGTKAQIRQNALDHLRDILEPGSVVYTKIESVARSGMSRTLSVYCVTDGSIKDITYLVARATHYGLSPKRGLKVSGCGFDAGFDVVYSLGYVLWPNGTPEPHGIRNGQPDTSSGYALRHEWL